MMNTEMTGRYPSRIGLGTPLHTPDKGQSAGGLYGDAVETIDWSTGEILKTLEDLGLERNTIVAFLSDNGADQNGWETNATWFGSNSPYRGIKQQSYEGGLRVLCVMWGPGRIPRSSAH